MLSNFYTTEMVAKEMQRDRRDSSCHAYRALMARRTLRRNGK